MSVSANVLLRMVAAGQLDVAFVHEVEGVRSWCRTDSPYAY